MMIGLKGMKKGRVHGTDKTCGKMVKIVILIGACWTKRLLNTCMTGIIVPKQFSSNTL